MAIIKQAADFALDLSSAFNKGVSQASQALTQKLTQQTEKRVIGMQASSLYDDLRTKWRSNITSGQLGEATHNLAKDIIENPNQTIQEIEGKIYRNAGIYAKNNEVEFSDALKNLEDAIIPIMTREGFEELPALTTKTQDEFNALWQQYGNAIEASTKNPRFLEDFNKAFIDRASNATMDELNRSLQVLKHTGKNLTGDETTDLHLLNISLENVNKQKIDQYRKILKSKLNKEEPIADANTDNLIRKLQDPTKSAKDILEPYYKLKVGDTQSYSRAEIKDILNEVDYMLKNRKEITKAKKFQKDDWENLTKLKVFYNKALNEADPGLDKPLSKAASNAWDEFGIKSTTQAKREDEKFIRQATGQNHLAGINYPRQQEITGQIDDNLVGIGHLKFRQDQVEKLLDSGTLELPELGAKIDKLMKMEELPVDIKDFFGAPNTTGLKSVDSFVFDQADLEENFFSAIANDIRYTGKGQTNKLKESTNAMYNKDTGEIEGYYWTNNMKLKILQIHNLLSNHTLQQEIDFGKTLNMFTGKELLATRVTNHLSDNVAGVIQNLLYAEGGDVFIQGMNKVLQAYPSYFDRLLTTDMITSLEILEELGKRFHVSDYYSELGKKIANSNLENKNELLQVYGECINDIELYTSKLRGKFITAQQLELPESYLIPHKAFTEEGDELDNFVSAFNEYNSFRQVDNKLEGLKSDFIKSSDEQNHFRANASWYTKSLDEEGIKIYEDTTEKDFIQNTMHLGGQVDISDYHKYGNISKPNYKEAFRKNVLDLSKTYKTSMSQYDYEDMVDLLDTLIGQPVYKGKHRTYPDRFTIQNKLNIIANYGDLDYAYGYLLDLQDFVKQQINKYNNYTPLPTKSYIDQKTGLKQSVDLDKKRQQVLTYLRNLDSDISRNLQQVITKQFKADVEASSDALAKQGHIVDSTSLDYMFDKGIYEYAPRKVGKDYIPRQKKTTISQKETNLLIDDYLKLNKDIELVQNKLASANKLLHIAEVEGIPYKYAGTITIDGLKSQIKTLQTQLEPLAKKKAELKSQLDTRNRDEMRKYFEIDRVLMQSANPTTQTERFIADATNVLDNHNWSDEAVTKVMSVTRDILKGGAILSKRIGQTLNDYDKNAVELLKKYGLDLSVYDNENRVAMIRFLDVLETIKNPERSIKVNEFLGRSTEPDEKLIQKYRPDVKIEKAKTRVPQQEKDWISDIGGIGTQADGLDKWIDDSVNNTFKETRSNIKAKTQADGLDDLPF